MNNEKYVSLFRADLNVIHAEESREEKINAVNRIRENVNKEYVFQGASTEELAEVYYHLGDSLLPMRGVRERYYYPLFFEEAYRLYKKIDDYRRLFDSAFWVINGYHQQTDDFCYNSMIDKAQSTADKAMYYFKDLLAYTESKECGKKQLYCEVMTIDGCSMLRSLHHDLFNSHLDEFLVDYYPEDKNTAQELYYYLGMSIRIMLTKEEIQNNSVLYTKYQNYYEKLRSLLNSL